eukprot:sb/3476404/
MCIIKRVLKRELTINCCDFILTNNQSSLSFVFRNGAYFENPVVKEEDSLKHHHPRSGGTTPANRKAPNPRKWKYLMTQETRFELGLATSVDEKVCYKVTAWSRKRKRRRPDLCNTIR